MGPGARQRSASPRGRHRVALRHGPLAAADGLHVRGTAKRQRPEPLGTVFFFLGGGGNSLVCVFFGISLLSLWFGLAIWGLQSPGSCREYMGNHQSKPIRGRLILLRGGVV